jgi:hypothetical protein
MLLLEYCFNWLLRICAQELESKAREWRKMADERGIKTAFC